ncbi:MAG TPA: anthranilate phosphoribosyltransferase, partial [Gemmatimonadales bacterium]
QAIAALSRRESLPETLAGDVFDVVMRGEASAAQLAALLMALRVKGETPEEVAGAARALRRAMVTVPADLPHLIDTCGTGGGAVSTFNVSTAAAFVAAGAGAAVAKHGNRSYTSKCGSADVLEALGVPIMLEAPQAAAVLRAARVVFLFAPVYHPSMRHVGPVRKELGITSIMNLLGPLANPAGVRRQVVGVADADRAPLLAGALAILGAEHALVVHGRVGIDEISPRGLTDVWEVRDGHVREWTIDPAPLGLEVPDLAGLRGGEPAENAVRVERLLGDGKDDTDGLAAVLLNAAAALYVAGIAGTIAQGVDAARAAIESGAARDALVMMKLASAAPGANTAG